MEVNSVSETNIEKWSTLKEVQEYLGVGRETILQWIAKRNMPAYKVGRLWKFKLSEVDECEVSPFYRTRFEVEL